MPQIPVQAEPLVKPSGQPISPLRIDARSDAFGSTVARGIREVGSAVSGAGDAGADAAIKFQHIQNQASVDEAYANKFSPEFRDMYQKYYALQGKDAVEQMPQYIQDMTALRNKHADDLANPAQKHLFNQMSRRRVEMELDGMARYADNQNKVWRKNTSDAFLKSQVDQAGDFYNDEVKFGSAIGAGAAEIDRYGAQSGQSSEEMRARVSKFTADVWSNRVRRMAMLDPLGAQKLYDGNKTQMTEHAVQLEHELKGLTYPVQARQIADASIAAIPATKVDIRAHMGEWTKEAEKRAEDLHPNDPLFRDLTVARVHAYVNTIATAQQGIEQQARSNLFLATVAGRPDDRPKDLDTLLAMPGMQDAWLKSDATSKLGVMSILDHNAKGIDPPTTPASLSTYYRLKGMIANDPEAFQSENLANYFKELPHHLSLQLITEQQRLDSKLILAEQKALAIAHAKSVAAPGLRAAGINTNPKAGSKDAKLYDQFVGRLQQGLDSFFEDNKRRPNDSEIRDMTNSLLVQGHMAGTGWIFEDKVKAFEAQGPGFYVPVPKVERTKIVDDYTRINGHPPTEGQIRDVYTRSQMRKKH